MPRMEAQELDSNAKREDEEDNRITIWKWSRYDTDKFQYATAARRVQIILIAATGDRYTRYCNGIVDPSAEM